MRVLMQNRHNYFDKPGGDTIQMLKTKEWLERLGVEVEVSTEPEPDVSGFDMVHVFNLQRIEEQYWQCRNAKKQGKPLALSPIYWTDRETVFQGSYSKKLELAKRFLGYRGALWLFSLRYPPSRYRGRAWQMQREAVEMADILLPNSRGEIRAMERDFHLGSTIRAKSLVAPNGVDPRFADGGDPERFIHRYGIRDFVLEVARIEPLKNQLALIQALDGIDARLVLIGQRNELSPEYCRACEEAANRRGQVWFLGQLPHEELPDAYAAARVHVLPSFRETTGLASLEAGLAGCQVVTTDRGPTREYFGDLAWYCDPARVSSIKRAVLSALEAPRSGALRRHILEHYTWERAAEHTLRAYRRALGPR